MKKMLLTAAVAFSSLIASAQFMVTADLDLEDFDAENITETTNFGFGYTFNDTWTVGAIIMSEGVQMKVKLKLNMLNILNTKMKISGVGLVLFVTIGMNQSISTANTSTEDFSDNLRLGAGYSFAALFFSIFLTYFKFVFRAKINYTMDLKADDSDERNATFKLGLAYRF